MIKKYCGNTYNYDCNNNNNNNSTRIKTFMCKILKKMLKNIAELKLENNNLVITFFYHN